MPPHADGELAEFLDGDLVAGIAVVAGEQLLGSGSGGRVIWGVIADVMDRSSRRVVVAEQTREDKPNISQITSESGVSGENRL